MHNTYNTWGADNLQIDEYICTRDRVDNVGQYVTIGNISADTDLSNKIGITNWYKRVRTSTWGYTYVGMDYATAVSCARSQKNIWTLPVGQWAYGPTDLSVGWYMLSAVPSTHATVTLSKSGNGAMYDVQVRGDWTGEIYGTKSWPTGNVWQRVPEEVLEEDIPGWSSYSSTWQGGHSVDTLAHACTLVTAPEWSMQYEVVPQQIDVRTQGELSVSVQDWYKINVDVQMACKWDGLSYTQAKSLHNSIANYSAPDLSVWEYVVSADTIGWRPVAKRTQALSEWHIHHVDGDVWRVDASLHNQYTDYRTSVSQDIDLYTTYPIPASWRSIPGISQFA